MVKFCECICGNLIEDNKRFVQGHNLKNRKFSGGNLKCVNCNNEFYTHKKRSLVAKFCSQKCYGEYKSKHPLLHLFKKGHKVSMETRLKQKEAKLKNPTRYWLNKHISKEHNIKLQNGRQRAIEENGHWAKGLTKETNESLMNISKKLTGIKLTESHKKKLSESWDYNKHITIERNKKISKSLKGKKQYIMNNKIKEKIRKSVIKLWKEDENYRNKSIKATLEAMLNRPTSFEKKIIDLCIENKLPFVYTGDGRILIGGKNPDFVNEKDKIIIEVFLNYFKIRDYGSVENYEKVRKDYFEKYGYKAIFIREEEIDCENWKEICLNKIKEVIT